MMNLSELAKRFRLLTDLGSLSEKEREFLQRFLTEENHLREHRRIAYLMKSSGIKRIKLLSDFDWSFNPKIPKDKIAEFMRTDWLKIPANLIFIGPAGVGKTHLATALCHDALTKGCQTLFLSLFDLNARLSKARNIHTLIEFFSKVPLLCLDELGYAVLNREQADSLFHIISRRVEVHTTILTTNLIPSQWGKVFDSVTASAILDRLSLNGKFITIEGRSYRSKK
jgi:DNA replication protein DnaC